MIREAVTWCYDCFFSHYEVLSWLIFLFLSSSNADRPLQHNMLTKYDLKRLDMYSKDLVDYNVITDLLPAGIGYVTYCVVLLYVLSKKLGCGLGTGNSF